MMMAAWARDAARSLLEEALPRRWAHVQGVAGKAESVAASLTLSGGPPTRFPSLWVFVHVRSGRPVNCPGG